MGSTHEERRPGAVAPENVHNYHLNNNQRRPDQHQRPEVKFSGVYPAPDKGPNSTGDYTDDPMYGTGVLKLFDQNQN
jgi:hypothetical protein